MGFLERAIRREVSNSIGRAVGGAISKAIEPQATELANRAAGHFDQAAGNMQQQAAYGASSFEAAAANLERAAQGYANELSKNMKICPGCGQPTDATKKFCTSCGTKMPEETLAQAALCPTCGKQNNAGVKFCNECGTRLAPAE